RRVANPSDLQVVRIVPGARARPDAVLGILEGYFKYPIQFEAQVPGRAPALPANGFAPFPDVSHPVLAKIVDDVPVLLLQQVSHETIRISIYDQGGIPVAKGRILRGGRLFA